MMINEGYMRECFYCPIIQEELWNRINAWEKFNGSLPDAQDIEDKIISSCYCDKTEYKIWYITCEENTSYQRLTEEEWVDYCNIHHIEYVNPYIWNESDNVKEIEEKIWDYKPEITKKQKKRIRDKKYRRKLRKLWENNKSYYPSPSYPVDKFGEYIDENEEGFIRYQRQYSPRRAKYLRKVSNKKVRKGKNFSTKGSGYKRVYDLWYELW